MPPVNREKADNDKGRGSDPRPFCYNIDSCLFGRIEALYGIFFFSSHTQNLLALLLQIKTEQRAAYAADDVHKVGDVILHQQHTVQLLA